ncbi:MAG: RNA-binding protein [Victivallales bacterium]|jgi:RNA recognition motif-containing protein|nr:RNA-binding protein [Victivallales bacterium]
MNIYVGNLPYSMGEDELQQAFEVFGEVTSARVIQDRETNRSKGFGFVEMADDAAGKKAIEGLNGSEMDGRNVVVSEARPRQERSGDGGGFRGGRGGRSGGGRDRGNFGGGRSY